MTKVMRDAIDAGLRGFCSETEDFDMSSAMRRDAVDHIMSQPGMFPVSSGSGPMVERAARAVSRELVIPDEGRMKAERIARAVMNAMLEPTPAMIRSVDDEDSDTMVARGRAYSAFVTMIQAALDEKEG